MSDTHFDHTVDELPGEERGMPSVNELRPVSAMRGAIVVVIFLVLCVGIGLAYWKYQKNQTRTQAEVAPKMLQLTSAVPTRTFSESPKPTLLPLPQETITQPVIQEVVVEPVAPTPSTTVPPLPSGSGYANGRYSNAPRSIDKAASSLMVGGPKSTNGLIQASSQGNGLNHTTSGSSKTDDGGMAKMLKPTQTASREAGFIGNQNFMLAKGSFINCSLQTRITSSVSGMTACVITRNVYSDNGKVLLVERGSTVTGEYRSQLTQGAARIFVLWNRLKTPNGVVVNLDSPGTGALGDAGVGGYVDNHFWERFGGAIMLSLVDDLARGISAQSDNAAVLNGTGDAAQNMAAEALKNTINIPPTLYKNQGEQVGIFVARDMDFSSVYDVAAK